MNYRDFSLDLFGYREEGGASRTFRVREVDRQKPAEAETATIPAGLAADLERLEDRATRPNDLIAIGTRIGDLLLPGSVGRLFRQSLVSLGEDGLRLRIRPESPPLARIPWELAYVPALDVPAAESGSEGFLALDRRISIVRYEFLKSSPARLRSIDPEQPVRVGALLADPATVEYPDLDVEEEERRLREGLNAAANIELEVYGGSIAEFERLIGQSPHVFHFAGHGEFVEEMGEEPGTVVGRGSLVLEGDGTRPISLPASRLAGNLRGSGVRLVVLSSCEGARRDDSLSWSGIAPALVRGEIPAVVAMQFTIRDDSAVAFTDEFYRTLADGRTIDEAVAAGRQAIANTPGGEGDRDWAAPVLYSRTEESLFPIRRGVSKRQWVNTAVLGLTVILASTWFGQHFYDMLLETPFAREVGAVRGSVAIGLALLSILLVPGLRERLLDWIRTRVGEWLARPRATMALVGTAVAVAAAYLLTSSVHVTADGVERPDRIAVTRGSDTLYSELSLAGPTNAARRVALAGGTRDLVFHVTSPPVYDSVAASSRWYWPTVRLSAAEFRKLDLPVLRLVPAWDVLMKLPVRGRASDDTVDVELESPRGVATFPNLHRGSVLVGADPNHLRTLWRTQDDEDVRRSLMRYEFWDALVDSQEEWMGYWLEDTTWVVPSLRSGNPLVIRLRDRSTDEVVALDTLASVAGPESVRTVFLDKLQ